MKYLKQQIIVKMSEQKSSKNKASKDNSKTK